MDEETKFRAGEVPEMHAPWGSQVKDYVLAAGGMLAGPGMALGLGRGVARPVVTGMGGETLKGVTRDQLPQLIEWLKTLPPAAARQVMQRMGLAQAPGMIDQLARAPAPRPSGAGDRRDKRLRDAEDNDTRTG